MFYNKVISLRVFLIVLFVSKLSFAQLEVLGKFVNDLYMSYLI